MTATWTTYDSPLGPLTLVSAPAGLTALHFPGEAVQLDDARRSPAPFADALRQLDAYFDGRRDRFDLALDLGGTPFQRAVWDALQAIPAGATTTYAALALALGRPAAVRAVGAAVGRTPVPIIVPCHRVLGSDGSLTGYRGGLERKRALLELERRGADGRSAEPGHVARPADATAAVSRSWTLIGADGERYASAVAGTLGGHRRGRIYGRLDCPSALRAIARGGYVADRVFFANEPVAVAAGYRPCAVCLPAAYGRWHRPDAGASQALASCR